MPSRRPTRSTTTRSPPTSADPGALANLRDRAGARGIRLASDMVPNHMGIDSRWVLQHPDRFLSLPDSPFPGLHVQRARTCRATSASGSSSRTTTTTRPTRRSCSSASIAGPATSATSITATTGRASPGTTRPSSTTPKAAVREAVIQTILGVARQFPVIRFDAAMVLAKKHIQRLWFPEPGQGGAIPSRAGHGLTRAEFDRAMPREFWREVVDRVAAEVPGTLLLAEAFWLLEGYFVRTLGMHRVYNSAFMNMLRDERNADYRLVIRNTLEFDPAILGRFVNFMSNPDERTAVDQFGTGDKYFGVAALMSTLPGLPMYGHGQMEGFTEKYGMEFRRAKIDESIDEGLLAHHERTIFPLLHRRASFAGADGFRLYDFVDDGGAVNEDVFAYSNVGPGGERSLVVYHNRYAETSGTIRDSVGFNGRDPDGERRMRRESLAVGLAIGGREDRWLRFRDAMSGLEGLRWSAGIARDGWRFALSAYRCHVLVDLAEIGDEPDRPVSTLAVELGDGWVPSIDEALLGIALRPVHAALRERLATAPRRRSGGAAPVRRTAVEAVEGRRAGSSVAIRARRRRTRLGGRRSWPRRSRCWTASRSTTGGCGPSSRTPSARPGSTTRDADRGTGVVRGLVLAGPARPLAGRHERRRLVRRPVPRRGAAGPRGRRRSLVRPGGLRRSRRDGRSAGRRSRSVGRRSGPPGRAPRPGRGRRLPGRSLVATLRSQPSSRTSRRSSGIGGDPWPMTASRWGR